MNKNKIFLIFILAVVGAVGAFTLTQKNLFQSSRQTSGSSIYYCPMHPTYTSDRPADCPICNMKLVKRENSTEDMSPPNAVIGDPDSRFRGNDSPTDAPREVTLEELMAMKPGEICLLHKCKHGQCMVKMTEEIARSGKCPHCGDDLGVIVKDLFPNGYSNVRLTQEKQQLMGIKTELVKKMPFKKTIRTVGRIASDPQLYQAQEEFIQAIQAFRKAEAGTIEEIKAQAAKLVDSARLRLKLSGLSDELISEIETAGKPDRSLLYGEAGGSVWLYAPIYEYEIPLVKIGDMLTVDLASLPGQKFEGKIRAIDPVIDPMSRSVKIRAQLQNPDGALKPEMYVNAMLTVNLGEVIAIPTEAVFATGERNIVFVGKENGLFEPREVELGAKTDNVQEVKSGISEGEQVVVSGNFLIDSESRLKSALSGHLH